MLTVVKMLEIMLLIFESLGPCFIRINAAVIFLNSLAGNLRPMNLFLFINGNHHTLLVDTKYPKCATECFHQLEGDNPQDPPCSDQ